MLTKGVVPGSDRLDQPDQTDTLLTIFNYNICNNVWSIKMICVSLHIERNKLKQYNIMTKANINVNQSINFRVNFKQSISRFFSLCSELNTMSKTECYYLYVSQFPTLNEKL